MDSLLLYFYMVRFVDALIVLIKKGRHVKEKKKGCHVYFT